MNKLAEKVGVVRERNGNKSVILHLHGSLMTTYKKPPNQKHSVGLHDEINSIIALVGLCSLSEQG